MGHAHHLRTVGAAQSDHHFDTDRPLDEARQRHERRLQRVFTPRYQADRFKQRTELIASGKSVETDAMIDRPSHHGCRDLVDAIVGCFPGLQFVHFQRQLFAQSGERFQQCLLFRACAARMRLGEQQQVYGFSELLELLLRLAGNLICQQFARTLSLCMARGG